MSEAIVSEKSFDLPPWKLFVVWLLLGLQSFGGGSATQALIRQAFIDRMQIVGDEEFSRMWGLVQMAPGINLLALTILIGRRCGGAFGVALSLLGLLLPSVSLTILLTACYSHIEHYAYVRDALRGVVPATVGVGMMVSWKMAKPLLDSTFREGKGVFVLCAILLAASGALVYFFPHDVIFILLGAGALAAAQTSVRLKKTKEE